MVLNTSVLTMQYNFFVATCIYENTEFIEVEGKEDLEGITCERFFYVRTLQAQNDISILEFRLSAIPAPPLL